MTGVDYVSLGPHDDDEILVFAEEEFRIDFQQAVHELMHKKGTSQKQLAAKLRVSEARVSQLFSENCNVTVRMIARIFFALGERPQIVFRDSHGGVKTYASVDPERRDDVSRDLASRFSSVRRQMSQTSEYSILVAEAAA